MLEVPQRAARLYVDGGVASPGDRLEVGLVCLRCADDEVGVGRDDRVDVDTSGRRCDDGGRRHLLGVEAGRHDAGGDADETIAGAQPGHELRGAGIESDDPSWAPLESDRPLARSPDRDRIERRRAAERLSALAAARRREHDEHGDDDELSTAHAITEYVAVRLFTPDEANEALRIVRPLVERLVRLRRALREIEAELADIRGKLAGNGRGGAHRVAGLESAAAKALAGIAALVEELEDLGVQVKDLDAGLVDFPARHPGDGTTVLLCWRLGEDEVGYWHELETGFAGRKPLPF